MSESKAAWTKAPWHANIPPYKGRIGIHHSDLSPGAISSPFAEVFARQTWRDEAIANAHLISAAPSLYEALHNALSLLKALSTPDDPIAQVAIREALGALALARGETK